MGLMQSISEFVNIILDRKPKTPMKFYMVGLDGAGKTSILYQFNLGEMIQTTPTIGFNVETVKYKNLTFNLWDVGGGDNIRPIWRFYLRRDDAIIFVFDSEDRREDRIKLAAEELHRFSSEVDKDDIPLLIYANKQDCQGAMSLEEITKALRPDDLKQKTWHIQLCSAKTREGLFEGLKWIGNNLRPKE